MKKILSLIRVLSILTFILGCDKNMEEPEPPCFDCPIDYSLIDSEAAWSPDGQRIAFLHVDSIPEKRGLYLISPSGNEVKQIGRGIFETPAWSPDGQWIAFSQNAQIWKMKINGDSLTQLTFEGRNFAPNWDSDISYIAYRRSYSWPEEISIQGIWIYDLSEETTDQVFSGNCDSPAWLNSENLIFFRGVVDNEGRVLGSTLYKIKIETSLYTEIIFIPNTDNRYLKFSSANNKIVFSSKPLHKPYRQIWTMDADGSNVQQLTDTQAHSCAWSPDGKHIVYTDSRKDNGRLWIMDEDGNNKRQLTFEHHFKP